MLVPRGASRLCLRPGLPLLQPPRHSPFTNFITSVPSLQGGTVPRGAEPGTLLWPGTGGDLPAMD